MKSLNEELVMNVLEKSGTRGTDEKFWLIEWDEKYVLGIPLIDRQNRDFVQVLNKLYSVSGAVREIMEQDFIKAANEAITCVRYNFWNEEKLMFLTEFSQQPIHKKDHEFIIDKILSFIDCYIQGKRMDSDEFVKLLKNWVLAHITDMDRVFADFILEMTKNCRRAE